MQKFSVRVQTESHRYEYAALVTCSIDAIEAATERFGPCSVTVMPAAAILPQLAPRHITRGPNR